MDNSLFKFYWMCNSGSVDLLPVVRVTFERVKGHKDALSIEVMFLHKWCAIEVYFNRKEVRNG
jgi:hypothetical protein